jgi:DUF4097 and DUF4098 domain-containing protein YvlB
MAIKAHQIVLGVFGGVLFFMALGITACVGGCVVAGNGVSMGFMGDRVKHSVTGEIEHVAGKPLRVETGNGRIEIVKSGDKQVRVSAELSGRDKARLEAATLRLARDSDGQLTVSINWPDGKRRMYEGASLRIEIPDATGLHLETGNGEIRASGFAGKLVADTSNGEIFVSDHDGPVHADTSNGPITLNNVGNVEADTSNGEVHVTLRDDATGPVKLDSSNGALKLTVGKAFKGTITADTSNGSVSATSQRATKVEVKKSSARVEFGEGDPSVMDTSNGSIEIRER